MGRVVPFVDLKGQSRRLLPLIEPIFRQIVESASFVGAPPVGEFEEAFAQFCGTRHCIGVASGTDALRFGLLASGIRPGDEVITVPNTFIATTEAISQAGAGPVFVDIDPRTYNIDVDKVKQAVTPRTKAILPVHLYGQCADMDPLLELAARLGLIVIEDACQAHGAAYRGRKAGSMGLAGCFSFYPGKNLGSFGEAGAVVTNDESIAMKVRMLRDHGQIRKYEHEMEGYNGRLDSLQAAVLRVKLRYLDQWNHLRREHARLYNALLAEAEGVVTPYEPEWSEAVYHLYVIRLKDRDRLRRALAQADIQTGLHYPIPLHLQKAYERLGYTAGDFPVAERFAAEILSLPMYPELTEEQITYVTDSIKQSLVGCAGAL